MKKLIVIAMAGVLSVSSMAGVLTWGSITPDGGDYAPFNDNAPSTFTGYAYLFLLTGAGNTVSWDSGTGSWNLNSAEQLAYSAAGSLDSVAGTWGNFSEAIADVKITPTAYYQVILTTATGNALLTGVTSGNGYWAPTVAKQVSNYSDIEGLNRNGLLAWQDSGTTWAPVAAVPEPATMALFGLGGLALVIRRKMRKEA